jgi:hypothetical protein
MNRRDWGVRVSWVAGYLPLGVLAALLVGLAGCTNGQILRSQCDEEADHEVKYDVQTVGDVLSNFANADPIPVGGVGLVVGLDGTGSTPPADSYRTMLEKELYKHDARNVKDLLNSPNISLVLVSAVIPGGARKGDPLDVEVTLPPGSRTTSLHGGHLKECTLYDYAFDRDLSARSAGSDRARQGHALAKAEGSLLVGFGDGDDAAKVRQGRIWGGARCKYDRPFYIVLGEKHQYARVASAVAERINETFHGSFVDAAGKGLAVAETKAVVVLQVPPQYRHNLPRYLRVVRLIPLREGVEAKDGKAKAVATASGVHPSYRRRLEEDLLDPARTVTAALRLEALGPASVPGLKTGLECKHPLVRFAAAEALAYLDSPSGGAVLAQMVEEHPMLRAFSLTALASMDQGISHVKLRELLASPKPETRYGAFRALRALDENDPVVQGELLNHSFWLHRVATGSTPLVHLSSSGRAEIALFGEEPMLVPPFELMAGGEVKFIVTGGSSNEQRTTITRFDVGHNSDGPRRQTRQCSLRVEDVLRTLAGMGGTYTEVVEVLRQAHGCQCVSCPVAVDQLPQAVSVQELARAGAHDPELLRLDSDILDARPDFGATPTLYQKSTLRTGSEAEADDEAARRDRKPHAGGGAEHGGKSVE